MEYFYPPFQALSAVSCLTYVQCIHNLFVIHLSAQNATSLSLQSVSGCACACGFACLPACLRLIVCLHVGCHKCVSLQHTSVRQSVTYSWQLAAGRVRNECEANTFYIFCDNCQKQYTEKCQMFWQKFRHTITWRHVCSCALYTLLYCKKYADRQLEQI